MIDYSLHFLGGLFLFAITKDWQLLAVVAITWEAAQFEVWLNAKKYKLTEDQALSAIKTEDKRRDNLYRRFGKSDYDHWNNYHLVINMTRTGLETAAEQICSLARK